ncbi:hypothetical protein STEG23_035692 [Scotinomys teguina]
MVNSFLHPIQRMLKQRDLKVSDCTIKGFLEDIDQAAPWFGALGDVNFPCWEKLGRDLIEAKGKRELRPGTLPLWCMICYCLKDGKCVDILREGRRALSAHQDSMSESDNKEKGNLKEERPKSSKASSKLHTKIEKEKETDQGKTKQKPSGLYPVLDEFADLTLSDSAEDELDSEEKEDLEEAAAAYEQKRYSPENTEPPPYYPPKAKLPGTPSVPVASNAHFIKSSVWGQLATAFPVFEDPTTHNRYHEAVGYKQLKDLAEAVRTYGVSATFTCFDYYVFFKGIFNFLFKGLYHLLKVIFKIYFFCVVDVGWAYGSGDLVWWLDGSFSCILRRMKTKESEDYWTNETSD